MCIVLLNIVLQHVMEQNTPCSEIYTRKRCFIPVDDSLWLSVTSGDLADRHISNNQSTQNNNQLFVNAYFFSSDLI